MRAGAIDGLSIGFKAVRARRDRPRGVRRIEQIDLWEISIVTFPMLPEARVSAVITPRAASPPMSAQGLLCEIEGTATRMRLRLDRHGRDPLLTPAALAATLAGERALIALMRIGLLEHKLFNPAQLRVPAGNPEGGQWTGGEGGGSPGPVIVSDRPTISEPTPGVSNYSMNGYGWHDYKVGPNLICTAAENCSKAHVVDYLSRFSVPGRDPSKPVVHEEISVAIDPRFGIPGGYIKSYVSNDGLTVTNVTRPMHLLHDGAIERSAIRNGDGSWSVVTRGLGNNVVPGMGIINQWQGPEVFGTIDRRLREHIVRHRGQR